MTRSVAYERSRPCSCPWRLGLALCSSRRGPRSAQGPARHAQEPAVRMVADDGRGREVLAAVARAVRTRPRRRQRLSRHVVGHREHRCGKRRCPGAATRRRSSGATASSSPPPMTTAGASRCSRYRRADGMKLWETFAPQGRTDDGSHYKNGHASATAATDGERIYVSFGSRGLFALDLNGKIIWHRDLGPMDAYHGAAGSPLLYKNRIILYQDQFSGLVHRRVRHAHRRAGVADGARCVGRMGHADRGPRRRSRRDHRQRPAGACRRTTPSRGQELWRCRGTTYEVIPTPVVGLRHGFLLVGAGGPDAGDQARRAGRRDAHSPRLDAAREARPSCPRPSSTASTSTWSTTWRAS